MLPGENFPSIKIKRLKGDDWDVEKLAPKNFSLLVVFRGLHCGICSKYLQALEANLNKFSALGVEVLAASADSEEKAKTTLEAWNLSDLDVGYGLDREVGKQLGLYLSQRRKDSEPETFFEPAMFWIDARGQLFFASVQNMPFLRPPIGEIVDKWIPFVLENAIPARGTLGY